MDLELRDKGFLIAGGSAGLGLGIARVLVAEGARVSICGRDGERLSGALTELGPSAQGRVLDLRDGAAINAWVDETARAWGRLDGLVLNAGGPPKGGFEAFDDAAWSAAFELTLLSAVRLARAARPHLALGGGSIVAITSGSVREPIDFLLLSNVLRPGVAALVKSLSRAWAAQGIRVNSLVPGYIETDRLLSLEAGLARDADRSAAEQRCLLTADVPLGRYGEVAEFARAGAFLLSPAASYITGTQLVVDGGRMRGV